MLHVVFSLVTLWFAFSLNTVTQNLQKIVSSFVVFLYFALRFGAEDFFPESSGKRKYMAGKRGVEKLSPKTFVFFGSCHTNYQLFQILDVCRSMSFHEASIQVA